MQLGLVFSIAVKQKAVNICMALFDKFIRIDTLIFSTTFLKKKNEAGLGITLNHRFMSHCIW